MKYLILLFSTFLLLLSCSSYTGSIKGRISTTVIPVAMEEMKMELTELNKFTRVSRDSTFTFKGLKPGDYTIKMHYRGTTMILASITVADDSISMCTLNLPFFTMPAEADTAGSPYSRYGRISTTRGEAAPSPAGSFEEIEELGSDFRGNTEDYERIDENGFFRVLENPLSTFAADVDGASYANVRRFIMQDCLPPKDAVRIEEFINYFPYSYKPPADGHPLSVTMEYTECPWNPAHQLVHIGIQGKTLAKEKQKASNLVFLIDVSGSMDDRYKLPLLKQSLYLLVQQLNPEDRIAIVTYAGSVERVLPSTPARDKKKILKALEQLYASGATAGGAALEMAYKTAEQNFIRGGNNRVILATDGDFNLGISSVSELVRFIEEKSKSHIFLSVLGFGTGNYKDNRLQKLADRGNGTHAYIDNILEAKKVLVHEITSTLFTIAKDVKIQVEFNPARIASYRLIGYENRKLQNTDFSNDNKDGGEIGSGHTVTALYEVIPFEGRNPVEHHHLKYQETSIRKEALTMDDILTVRIRYKEPDALTGNEISMILKGPPVNQDMTSDNFRFSAAVAEFAMILRDSGFRGNASFQSVKSLAYSSLGSDPYGYRSGFLNLVEQAEMLTARGYHASRSDMPLR